MRRAARRDEAERPIVQALEAAGCIVYRSLPSDLLIHRRRWGPGWFRVQEVKTPGGKGVRRSQKDQATFLADTGTPIVRTPEEAIADAYANDPDGR